MFSEGAKSEYRSEPVQSIEITPRIERIKLKLDTAHQYSTMGEVRVAVVGALHERIKLPSLPKNKVLIAIAVFFVLLSVIASVGNFLELWQAFQSPDRSSKGSERIIWSVAIVLVSAAAAVAVAVGLAVAR